ncbi:SH3 domain-containing protein, partial [Streptococcus suis]|uniref:SH3 domain-containing protein n=1 Tax=Streptococcus suis TaxID=1307 RepID=UPI0037567AF6
MATTANKILVEAKKYIGVSGGTTTHKMFIDTYNSVSPLPQGYAVKYHDDWCDAFISFLAIKTNAVDIIGRECGVDRHISIFKQLGIWNEDGNIVPKPGAIITFHWSKTTQPNDGFADHIGIVEKVEGNYVHTIEGNSSNAVARRSYVIGDGRIRGYAFPRYISSSAEYSGGSLVNAGNMISQENIRLLIKYSQKYSLKPSFLLAQMFIESHWGNPNVSSVGQVDNNWSGISEPFHAPTHLGISMRRGTARPTSEGGYYVHFNSMEDYFKAYTYILSNENGLYKVSNVNNIDDFCKGLFRIGGAKSDYAGSGFEHYKSLLLPTYEAIKQQNNGKLELIDSSVDYALGNYTDSSTAPNIPFTRISETGRFYPNQTVTIRNHPSRSGGVVGQYNSGESFSYDSYVVNDGHIWLSYVSYSGERRYVAWRVQNGTKFGTIDEPNSTPGSQNSTQFTRVPETGRFYPNQTVTIRNHPSRSGGVVG